MLQAMLYGASVGNSCPASSRPPLLLLNVSGISEGLQLMQDRLTVINVPAAVVSTSARFVMLASTLLLVVSCILGLLGLRWAQDLYNKKGGCCWTFGCSPFIFVTISMIIQIGFLLQMALWSGVTVYLELERLFSRGYRSTRLGQFLTFTLVPLLVFWSLLAYLARGYRCLWRYIRFLRTQTNLGSLGSSVIRLSGEIASGEQELNGHYGQIKQRVSPDASRLISSKRISPETRIEMLKPRVSSSQKKLTATCVPAEEPGGQTDLCMHSYVNQPRYENQLPSDASRKQWWTPVSSEGQTVDISLEQKHSDAD
ncbi:hypothetical protein AAVH_07830 [Aphelenchoides avenae]|nr:hypothetical protein AAVH_07830 [Aphelenchus avenae]